MTTPPVPCRWCGRVLALNYYHDCVSCSKPPPPARYQHIDWTRASGKVLCKNCGAAIAREKLLAVYVGGPAIYCGFLALALWRPRDFVSEVLKELRLYGNDLVTTLTWNQLIALIGILLVTLGPFYAFNAWKRNRK